MIKWHSDWFKPGSSTIVVTGDMTMDKLLPALESTFGEWKAGKAPPKSLPTAARTSGKKIYLMDKPNAPQSVILAAHVSETPGQSEDLASEPLFTNFGGIATSRLSRNLRLDKHWAYSTSGGLLGARGQRTFFASSPVQYDKTKEAMAEIMREINDIAGARPIKGAEFDSIMRNMTSRLAGRFETLASLENAAFTMINYGLPDELLVKVCRRNAFVD